MRLLVFLPLTISAITLAGCDNSSAEDATAPIAEVTAPDTLKIGSAKRQCVMTASLSGEIPKEISEEVCGCTMDRLIEEKHFAASREPTEAEADVALETCIDEFLREHDSDLKQPG